MLTSLCLLAKNMVLNIDRTKYKYINNIMIGLYAIWNNIKRKNKKLIIKDKKKTKK